MSFTAKEWRERAEKARGRAEELTEQAGKHLMLSIAASYDRLAEMAGHPGVTSRGKQTYPREW
jgi:hypothetical protein